MSSLSGAPNLGGGAKQPFTYNVDWDDKDDEIPEVTDVETKHSKKNSGKKSKDKEREKPTKSEHTEKRAAENDKAKGKRPPKAERVPVVEEKVEDEFDDEFEDEDDYKDDFGEEEMLDSDDYIPPVTSTPPLAPQQQAPPQRRVSPVSTKSRGYDSLSSDSDRHVTLEEVEERLRAERQQHERKMQEWEAAQADKEREHRQRQAQLQREIEALKNQEQAAANDVAKQVERLVAEKLAAATSASAAPAASTTESKGNSNVNNKNNDEDANDDYGTAEQQQQQRRRQRERERALQLRRLHDEEAARSLFQRLAQDVREVFHELNLSVVAAEKERLIKDERYRKDREAKERREEMGRAEKLEKELKERAQREEKFWTSTEEREDKLRAFMEDRLRKDEEEREARLKRDLEDRAARTQNERELRDQLEQMEKERRAKQDSDVRQRDSLVYETQLNEMKAQYGRQIEEVRRQNDLAREHSEELHKAEMQMVEKRSEAALERLLHQHAQQLAAMESHAANASRLEKLIENMHAEMDATKRMNEKLTEERVALLKAKEAQLAEQKAVLEAVTDDLRSSREDLDKERVRVVGLFTKFELSISTFAKNAEADRLKLQEAQAHFETLRLQAEKDRRLMLSEVAQERKVLEQQQEELLARKMESLGEIQAERVALGRERTEAAVARERQNREEGDLLKSLREREMEYTSKIDQLEADRVTIAAMKAEQRQLLEQSTAERENLRREREVFEREKAELLGRFEDIRRRAEDAASSQNRLRKELVEQRAAHEYGISPTRAASGGEHAALARIDPNYPPHSGNAAHAIPVSVASRLQMDLARQRAVLQKITL